MPCLIIGDAPCTPPVLGMALHRCLGRGTTIPRRSWSSHCAPQEALLQRGLRPSYPPAPSKQGAYDWLANVRDQYLYSSKDCHFRPAIAQKAIGLLLVGRALDTMRRSRPNSVHILVVCSWNVKADSVHQEMHATAELCQAKTLQEVGSIAAGHSHKKWILRRYLEPGAMDRPMPKTAFPTYIHDDRL